MSKRTNELKLSGLFWSLVLAVLCLGLHVRTLQAQEADVDAKGDQPTVLTPIQAIERIGQGEMVVRLTVKHAKERFAKRGLMFLDSEEDFEHEANLGIAISSVVGQTLREKHGDDLEAYFLGKTLEVRGCVMRFENRPYLPVLSIDQLRVIELTPQPSGDR